jgi:hypothetical protein
MYLLLSANVDSALFSELQYQISQNSLPNPLLSPAILCYCHSHSSKTPCFQFKANPEAVANT